MVAGWAGEWKGEEWGLVAGGAGEAPDAFHLLSCLPLYQMSAI